MSGFDWARIPPGLARDLARELALDPTAAPVDALRTTFGPVPDTEFVRVAWSVLRDTWLARDADGRTDVIAALRAAGLRGDDSAPRGAAAQLAYLRRFRNSSRLRETVLERFLELGDPNEEHHVPQTAPASAPDPETIDLAAKVEEAWRELSAALTEALLDLDLGDQLTVTLDPTAGGTGDATYYVEFTAREEGELHAEAVGNASLPPGHRLDRHAIADLVALGWSPPGVVDGTGGNFGLSAAAGDAPRLAAVAVRTLREVFGTPHPAFLTYTATGVEGEAEIPQLGAARRQPASRVARAVVEAEDRAAPLRTRVQGVVSALLGRPAEELPVDTDGDIPIRSGSAMVFVRVHDDPPLVDVYSPLLTGVRVTERLYERISKLTRTMPIGRLYVEDTTVWASVGVIGTDFQPTHLRMAITVMTGLADTLDDRLQGDFGGKVFFGEALPERREQAVAEARTGMYL